MTSPVQLSTVEFFLFADDSKCFKHKITVPSNMQLLQHDLNCLSNWSIKSLLTFYPSKSIHLSFKCKIKTSYYINGSPMNSSHSHTVKAWEFWFVIILTGMSITITSSRRPIRLWDLCIEFFAKPLFHISNGLMVKLYVSLVRSQILFCVPSHVERHF